MPKLDPRFIPPSVKYIHMRSGETCWVADNLPGGELLLANADGVRWVVSRQMFEDEYQKAVPKKEYHDPIAFGWPMNMANKRSDILEEAIKIVSHDRNKDYGDPEDNFKDIAFLWNTYLAPASINLNATDVAAMMVLMKVSRIKISPNKRDHWVDIAGYAACGGGLISEPEHLSSKEEGHDS